VNQLKLFLIRCDEWLNNGCIDQGKKHVNSVQQSLSGVCYCESIHILRFSIKSLAKLAKVKCDIQDNKQHHLQQVFLNGPAST